MRQTLTSLGLEGTALVVRDDDGKTEVRRITGDELRKLIEQLERLESVVTIIERRGIDFARFLAERRDGKLPQYRTIVDGVEKLHLDAAGRDAYLGELNIEVADEDMSKVMGNGQTNGDATLRRLQKNQELHEVKELAETLDALSRFGLSIDDYYLTQEESVSGDKLPTKYALVAEDGGKVTDIAGVAQILPQVLQLGKQGIE